MAKWISFQKLRNHVSMKDILRHYGLMEKFRRSKNEVIGLCPFHEETTASFHVSITKNVFHCFGCQSKGNILDFVVLTEGVDVRQAAFMIQEWFQVSSGDTSESAVLAPEVQISISGTIDEAGGENPPLTFRLKDLNPKHPYLAERGLETETIEYFGLGYCSRGLMRGRVVIPIHDERGELVAYSGRYPGDPPEGRPKYLLPSGFRKSHVVFNLHRAGVFARENGLVVVEGFFDLFRVWQAGFHQVVAIMGSSLSERQRDLLLAFVGPTGKIALLLDQDDAGRICLNQCIDELSTRVFVEGSSRVAKRRRPTRPPDRRANPTNSSRLVRLKGLFQRGPYKFPGVRRLLLPLMFPFCPQLAHMWGEESGHNTIRFKKRWTRN